MKILELFSGTESFSKVAKKRGHDVFTVDNDPRFKPDLCIDIMKLKPSDIPFKPDIIWASPPCEKFSIMVVSKNWDKIGDSYRAKNEETVKAMWLIVKTLELIGFMKPKFFFIENPRAMLRKMPFMADLMRKTVTYCKYGFPYMKATDIWTNCEAWTPRPICKANDPCHVSAPRGSVSGVQGLKLKHYDFSKNYNWDGKGKIIRGKIPPQLCAEILKVCENEKT